MASYLGTLAAKQAIAKVCPPDMPDGCTPGMGILVSKPAPDTVRVKSVVLPLFQWVADMMGMDLKSASSDCRPGRRCGPGCFFPAGSIPNVPISTFATVDIPEDSITIRFDGSCTAPPVATGTTATGTPSAPVVQSGMSVWPFLVGGAVIYFLFLR